MSVLGFFSPEEENGYLSNWYLCEFKYGRYTYSSTEQFMMAQKALLFRDFEIFEKVLKTTSPKTLKRLGKQVKNYDDAIDDTPILTVKQIEERLDGIDNLGLVVIDHDQLLCLDRGIKNREQECNEIGRQLKSLSNQKNVPIIITSNLPRRLERRRNKRPLTSDLKELGVNANNMDTICFVYREGYYFPLEKHEEAEIIISKNKYGNCKTVTLKCQGEFMKFNYSDET